MKANQARAGSLPAELPFAEDKCEICGTMCLPYGYTSTWGHLCSRKCSDAWDKKKYALTDRQ